MGARNILGSEFALFSVDEADGETDGEDEEEGGFELGAAELGGPGPQAAEHSEQIPEQMTETDEMNVREEPPPQRRPLHSHSWRGEPPESREWFSAWASRRARAESQRKQGEILGGWVSGGEEGIGRVR